MHKALPSDGRKPEEILEMGREALAGLDGYLTIVYGDGPLLRAETLERIGGTRQAAAAGAVANSGDALSLSPPEVATFGATGWIDGTLAPARAGVSVDLIRAGTVVAQAQTTTNGSFAFNLRFVSPGPYQARSGSVSSATVSARIRPLLTTSVHGDRVVGQPLRLRAHLQPAAAGKLRLIVIRGYHRSLSRFVAAGKPFTFALSRAARHAVCRGRA